MASSSTSSQSQGGVQGESWPEEIQAKYGFSMAVDPTQIGSRYAYMRALFKTAWPEWIESYEELRELSKHNAAVAFKKRGLRNVSTALFEFIVDRFLWGRYRKFSSPIYT